MLVYVPTTRVGRRTWPVASGRSRRAFGSGVVVLDGFWMELKELFTLPLGVDVCDGGPGRFFAMSRLPPPGVVAPCDPGPCDDDISLVAAGSALGGGLFFFPKRKDMAAFYRGRALQWQPAPVRSASNPRRSWQDSRVPRWREEGGWWSRMAAVET
jgi:hypothetical protein